MRDLFALALERTRALLTKRRETPERGAKTLIEQETLDESALTSIVREGDAPSVDQI